MFVFVFVFVCVRACAGRSSPTQPHILECPRTSCAGAGGCRLARRTAPPPPVPPEPAGRAAPVWAAEPALPSSPSAIRGGADRPKPASARRCASADPAAASTQGIQRAAGAVNARFCTVSWVRSCASGLGCWCVPQVVRCLQPCPRVVARPFVGPCESARARAHGSVRACVCGRGGKERGHGGRLFRSPPFYLGLTEPVCWPDPLH